jgi:hypothetical protein
MNITITLEQYEKIKLLSRYSDYYLDDQESSGDQYESDREDITQAQEVLQDIDNEIYWLEEQERRSARTDAWIKQANQDIERGLA